MSLFFSQSFDRAGRLWCRAFHKAPMWPVNGYYRCPDCLRTFPVAWANQPAPTRQVAVMRPKLASRRLWFGRAA